MVLWIEGNMGRRGQRYVDKLVAEFTGKSKTGGLTEAQQSELTMKLRFGLGIEQMCGAEVAAEIRRDVKFPLSPSVPSVEPESPQPEPSRSEVHRRAAAMGVTVGKRGQWIRG